MNISTTSTYHNRVENKIYDINKKLYFNVKNRNDIFTHVCAYMWRVYACMR